MSKSLSKFKLSGSKLSKSRLSKFKLSRSSLAVIPFSALVALFGTERYQPAVPLNLSAVDIRPQWESAWIQSAIANDPAAKAIVGQYISSLSASGYNADRQGVWVSSGQYTIAESQGSTPRPAASLTKIATTLAALSTWGPSHKFETWVGWRGSLDSTSSSGVINGDLVIKGSSDPLFVWEEAIALGNTLQQQGIRRVTGDIIIAGNFTMNFEDSPSKSGTLLKQALNSAQWNDEVQAAHQRLAPGTPMPSIQIDGSVRLEASSLGNRAAGWLVRHDSLPLVGVLKAMNIYSNNPMAEQLANTVGGPSVVVQKAAAAAGVPSDELQLINGSGLGEANQMSPRAAVAMLQEMQDILRSHNLTISDIFPIAGADGGTILERNMPNNAVVKTGSLAVVSTLAGAFPTKDKGIIWFSLLNYGSGLDALRGKQDQVLRALEQQWGRAAELPPELRTRVVIGRAPYQFGDPQRNIAIANE